MSASNPTPNQAQSQETEAKPTRDNVILIIAIVVAVLNFVGVISAIIAFNWLSVILGLLNTLVWVAVILVQLRRASARRK
jgi:amino acid permease